MFATVYATIDVAIARDVTAGTDPWKVSETLQLRRYGAVLWRVGGVWAVWKKTVCEKYPRTCVVAKRRLRGGVGWFNWSDLRALDSKQSSSITIPMFEMGLMLALRSFLELHCAPIRGFCRISTGCIAYASVRNF
jgi:hypothetical protein